MTIRKSPDYFDFFKGAVTVEGSKQIDPLTYRSQELLKDKVGGLVYGVALDRFLNVGGLVGDFYLIDSCSIGYVLCSNQPESLIRGAESDYAYWI